MKIRAISSSSPYFFIIGWRQKKFLQLKPYLLISPFAAIPKWRTFQKWNYSSLVLNEASRIILDIYTGPISSRNSVWHKIPSKKTGSVHNSLWVPSHMQERFSTTINRNLSKLKLFYFQLACNISEQFLIIFSVQ